MGLNNYSIALDKNTKNSRLGCSVCKKKVKNDPSIENLSSKPWIDKRQHLKNVSNEKVKNCHYSKLTPSIILRPTGNECYCNHMEQTKNVSFPRLICSKRFKTPHETDVDKKWFHEIIEFRRQNWFDCHTDSCINDFAQNINPINIFNKHTLNCLNCNHPYNSISLTSTDDDELKTDSPFKYMDDSTLVKTHLNAPKKTTVSKFAGKNSKAVYKPWIPPSPVHYRFKLST